MPTERSSSTKATHPCSAGHQQPGRCDRRRRLLRRGVPGPLPQWFDCRRRCTVRGDDLRVGDRAPRCPPGARRPPARSPVPTLTHGRAWQAVRMTTSIDRFRDLHADGTFVMPNPHDLGSARLLATLGFKALASTSAGFAATLGRLDMMVSRDELLAPRRSTCRGHGLAPQRRFRTLLRRRSCRRHRDRRVVGRRGRCRVLDRGLEPRDTVDRPPRGIGWARLGCRCGCREERPRVDGAVPDRLPRRHGSRQHHRQAAGVCRRRRQGRLRPRPHRHRPDHDTGRRRRCSGERPHPARWSRASRSSPKPACGVCRPAAC